MAGEMFAENYQNIPRFYTAIAEWGACFMFCLLAGAWKKEGERKKGLSFWMISLVMLGVQCFFLEATGELPTSFWLLCMLAAVGMMYLYLFLMLSGTWQQKLYICFKAFLIAEFVASLEWQLEYFFHGETMRNPGERIVLLLSVYGAGLVFFWLLERGMQKSGVQMEITGKELLSSGMIVAGAFSLSNLSFVYQSTPFTSGFIVDIFNIRTLVDLGGVAILYAYQSRLFELNAEREVSALNNMLKSQYEHYRNYQESIDLINIKYHDLKHQLEGLRTEMDPDRRAQWLNRMEEELSAYQPEQQTGNQVLDGIIDGKTAVMRGNQIKFTCVTDGSLLSFMHVTDICAIFGNALDNAIEHVIQVPDPEKRMIHLQISARKQFVFAEIRNYSEEADVPLKAGFPVTTKSDRRNHGFGLKSIDCTVKKYHGTLNFGQKDGFFTVKILIPMP